MPKTSQHLSTMDLFGLIVACLTISIVFYVYSMHMSMYNTAAPFDHHVLTGDYLPFWAAGHMALDGQGMFVYDYPVLEAVEKTQFPTKEFFLPWLNSPAFLLIMTPLSSLDFGTSYWIWSIISSILYVLAMWLAFRNFWLLAGAFIFPPFINSLFVGQSGTLSAAFLILGCIGLLKNKPVFAGIMFGFLIIKPQLAILIPFALLFSKNYKAFLASALTVCAVIVMSSALFGPRIWLDFLINIKNHNSFVHSKSFSEVIYLHSFYGFFKSAGRYLDVGAVLQSLIALLMIIFTCIFWSKKSFPLEQKISLLIPCTLLFHSYSLYHDYIPLLFAFGLWFMSFYKMHNKCITIALTLLFAGLSVACFRIIIPGCILSAYVLILSLFFFQAGEDSTA